MVYFKINATLHDVIKKARLTNRFVGCQIYCDRQFISLADLKVCIQ